MKKTLIACGAAAALLFIIFFSHIRLGVLTALFMWDMLDGSTLHAPERGKLAWLTASPAMKTVEIAGKDGQIAADLYCIEGGKPRAGLLLTHGIIEDGKNDPRLKRFAYSLARVGFAVLVPDLKGMKSFRIAFSDVDDIVPSTHYLASLKAIVDP